SLSAIEPSYGTAGQRVVIFGGPFTEPVELWFDGVAAAVTRVTETEVEAEVPSLPAEGTFEVELRAGGALAPSPLEYRYFDDAAGRIGALGMLEWDDLRGNYWDAYSFDRGFAQVMFTYPTDVGWPQLLFSPVIEHCESDYQIDDPVDAYVPGVPAVSLLSGAGALTIPVEAAYPYLYYAEAPVAPGSDYDLGPMVGGAGWPEFAVANLSGVVPTSMDVTYPPLDGDEPASVDPSYAVQWGGPYDGDGVLLWMQRQRWDGADWIQHEVVTCWVDDDGNFALPNLWTDWQSGDGVLFYIARYREPAGVTLPFNQGDSAVVGAFWTVGFLVAN
ncbi:MAG: IPT/TIG domain-containing protein, partial [Myxococcota bacterium]